MNPIVVIWILAVVVALFVGREVGKWLFGQSAKVQEKKRAAQVLAAKLRDNGLRLLPTLLEDFVRGNAQDMLEKVCDLVKLIQLGSDAIEKELEAVYERVLDAKLAKPEGLARIKAKIAVLEASAPSVKEPAFKV